MSISMAVIALLISLFFLLHTPVQIETGKLINGQVDINYGSNLIEIADSLYSKGIIRDKLLFIQCVRLTGKEKELQAGTFDLKGVHTYLALVDRLSRALPRVIKVTIPEGLKTEKIASIFSKSMQLDSLKFIKLIRSGKLAKVLGLETKSLDGYLLPNTYYFLENQEEEEVISRLVKNFFEVLPEDWRSRCDSLGYSLHEIVTLASLVEGEAMKDEERPVIAAVYYNRLKKRMKLQSDPTIQFLLPRPRRLLKRDLEIDSPYNTYIHYGLPPGPINNPGMKSILAAFFPAKVDYLYFVARGDGYHVFTSDYKEFLKAKKEFQKVRRQVLRERRRKN